MPAQTPKLRVFHQNTKFCSFTAAQLGERFGGRVSCEPISGYREGRTKAAALAKDAPALLIWGDGLSHHLSNALNIPRSVKYVFDNHGDSSADCGAGPAYDSHNSFSQREGVLVRVCHSAGKRSRHSIYDEGQGNGMLHISLDLDFLAGFPALPFMSVGSNTVGALLECSGALASEHSLRRLDIGGYHERGDPSEREMRPVYGRYYAPLLEPLIERML